MFNLQESEKELQDNFINQLKNQDYEYVELKNEEDLISNFKMQLEIFNRKSIDNFDEILNYLCDNTLDFKFDKLRSSFEGIKFIDFSDFSSNIFQVSQEISVQGQYSNRYDVTILINGLPLVQVELKNSSINLQDAFNQIQRYSKHSYANLFDYVQIFVISNKVHTRYFFNDSTLDYDATYVWKNSKDLESFTTSFLDKQNLLNVISIYIFKDLISNQVKMLRPYQIDAIEKVINQIDKNENAYVWMSYNTGKTLTSLWLAQLLKDKYKVIYLTTNHLSRYPHKLVVKNKNKFLRVFKRKGFVIANIRSLLSLKEKLDEIKNDKIIFILNEYEKFNEKYDPLILKNTFKNSLFYCFTSAPIFDENLINDETTKFIFDNKIYSYSFKNALSDNVNLDFEVEYVDDENIDANYNLSSKTRIKAISDYILDNIEEKTFNGKYKSIVFTSSNSDLIEYYSYLKNSDLKIAPILRYDSNDIYEGNPLRDYFEKYVLEYNENFDAEIENKKIVDTTKVSDQLEADIIKRFNNGEIDLLLIDESMLTNKFKVNILGNLKNPQLNTIFLDCNLKYESLFEVMSMVNENDRSEKNCGNLVAFRDIRNNVNDAIKLFSNNNASETYTLKPYTHYLERYNELLSEITTSDNFLESYKKLSTNFHILERFKDFDLEKSQVEEFNKYKDLYNHEKYRLKSSKKVIPKFNLKAIDKYTINLDYVNDLLAGKITNEVIPKNITSIEDSTRSVNINELHVHVNTSEIAEGSLEDVVLNKLENTNDVSNTTEKPQNNFENEEYPVTITQGDLIENLNIELKFSNLAENIEKINSKECNHCGRMYDNNTNFCHYDVGIKLIDPKEFKKVCPECGMKYGENENYCHKHPGVKLIDIKHFPKICPKCGRRYKVDINFCHNDIGVRLVTQDELVKYCPDCGAKYPENEIHCSRCVSESELKDIIPFDVCDIDFKPNELYNLKSHTNEINSLDKLLSSENINKLSSFTIKQEDYDMLLKNIINTHELILNKVVEDYEIDLNSLSPLDKILLYAKTFVKVKFKSSGSDLGRFIFNNIILEDRKPEIALQITTVIHELSHFLLSEIFEQIIMEVLDTKKSDVIEGFVCYMLIKNDFNKLLDEFSAHSVESKYTMYGYQDFSSYKEVYNHILKSGEYNQNEVEIARIIGNSFARDIKIIFDSIIDNDLRNAILDEFKNMKTKPNYDDLSFEIDGTLEFEDFLSIIKAMILDAIDNIGYNELEKLQKYIIEFKKNNN